MCNRGTVLLLYRFQRIFAVLTDAALAHDVSRYMFAHLAVTIDVVEGRFQLQNLSFHISISTILHSICKDTIK